MTLRYLEKAKAKRLLVRHLRQSCFDLFCVKFLHRSLKIQVELNIFRVHSTFERCHLFNEAGLQLVIVIA